MEENYYRERNVMTKLPMILLISIGVLLLIILGFFLFKNLNKSSKFDVETEFTKIGKEYYNKYSSELPKETYECTSVSLENILAKGLVKKVENYSSCNKYNTKMKVCKLKGNSYQYTPMLVCDGINTEEKFSDWKVGTVANLIADSSDVAFGFLGYKKIKKEAAEPVEKWEDEITVKDYNVISKTTYYRYRDKEWQWQEKKTEYFTNNDVGTNLAYYATSPNSDYTNSDSQTTAYKWYTQVNVGTAPTKLYKCKNPLGSATSTTTTPCSESIDGKTETVKEFYTCDVVERGKSNYTEVEQNSSCDCSSEKYGTNCAVKRSYYPSSEEVANRETVYYVSAPVSGAIKDVTTKLNASRYYKEVITTTDKYYQKAPTVTSIKVGDGRWGSWSEYSTTKPKEYDTRTIESRNKIKYELKDSSTDDWDKISDDYLTLEEFINKLKSLEYNVNSIKDINNNEELKYDVQLKYRNKNN